MLRRWVLFAVALASTLLFQGQTYVFINPDNIQVSQVINRAVVGSGDTNCAAPCYIYARYDGTTASAVTSLPYGELDYKTNWGDTGNYGTIGAITQTTDPCGSSRYHLHFSGWIDPSTGLHVASVVTDSTHTSFWNPVGRKVNVWNSVGLDTAGNPYGGIYAVSLSTSLGQDLVFGDSGVTVASNTLLTAQTAPTTATIGVTGGSYAPDGAGGTTVTLNLSAAYSTIGEAAGFPVNFTGITRDGGAVDASLTTQETNPSAWIVTNASSGSTIVADLVNVVINGGATGTIDAAGTIAGVQGGPGIYSTSNSQAVGSSGSQVQMFAGPPAYCSPNNTSKNVDYGPSVGHLYTSPGTYTITVYVTDINNNTVPKSTQVFVQDPNIEWGGNWSGTTCNYGGASGSPAQSVGCTVCLTTTGTYTNCPSGGGHDPAGICSGSCTLASIVSTYAGGVGPGAQGNRILIHRNDTFTVDTTPNTNFVTSHGMLGSYDTGALPIWSKSATCNCTLFQFGDTQHPTNEPVSDWRWTDMDYYSTAPLLFTHDNLVSVTCGSKQVVFYNVVMRGVLNYGIGVGQGGSTNCTNPGAVNSPNQDISETGPNWQTPTGLSNGACPDQIGFFNVSIAFSQQFWDCVTRLTVQMEDAEDSSLGDWNLRIEFAIEGFISRVYMPKPQPNTSMFLLHGDPRCGTGLGAATCKPYWAGHIVVSDSYFPADNSLNQAGGVSVAPQTASANEPMAFIILERDFFTLRRNIGAGMIASNPAPSYTWVRANLFDCSPMQTTSSCRMGAFNECWWNWRQQPQHMGSSGAS